MNKYIYIYTHNICVFLVRTCYKTILPLRVVGFSNCNLFGDTMPNHLLAILPKIYGYVSDHYYIYYIILLLNHYYLVTLMVNIFVLSVTCLW